MMLTSSHRDHFRAIRAAPDDHAPLLIFADWLEEQGQAERALAIRLGVAQLALDPEEPAFDELGRQIESLWSEHGTEWDAELPELSGVGYGFPECGLVRSASFASMRSFRRHAARVFRDTAVSRVSFGGPLDLADIEDLARSPLLVQVESLAMDAKRCGPGGAAYLAMSPHLNLTSLSLIGNQIGDAGLARLAENPGLARVRHLLLASNRITSDGLGILLAKLGPAGQLRELNLSNNPLGPLGAERLARSAACRDLRLLWLDHCDLRDAGAAVLARCGRWPALASFSVMNNDIGDLGAVALAGAATFSHLDDFNLAMNRIGDEGAKALAESRPLAGLSRLDLARNRIGDVGAWSFVHSPNLVRLLWLDLGGNPIGRRPLAALRHRWGTRADPSMLDEEPATG